MSRPDEPLDADYEAFLSQTTNTDSEILDTMPDDGAIPDDAMVNDRATELANAEEIRRRFGNVLRWDCDAGAWLYYRGQRWEPDERGHAKQAAKQVARAASDRLQERNEKIDPRELLRYQRASESSAGINGALELLKSEPGISVTSSDLDRDPFMLNCQNGTLRLKDKPVLLPHSADDLQTKIIATHYDPAARCPLWESVVHRSMNGRHELAAYLQRMAGLFLTGDISTQELWIPYGAGANGKSVIFDTLRELLGPYAGVAPESLLMVRNGSPEHPTELARMRGLRLVVASETESGATLRMQLVKRLTGDKTIVARFMRQDYFEFERTHKTVLITNNRPRITENTEAVWRRLRLLPFDCIIPPNERDPNLIGKLRDEYPGILAWAVQGCIDFQRNGMNPPEAVMVATNEYRQDADELAEFVEARCMVAPGDTFRASRADLYAAYTAWTKTVNERHPMERKAFYDAIRRRDGIEDAAWKSFGKVIRGFDGIAISRAAVASTSTEEGEVAHGTP